MIHITLPRKARVDNKSNLKHFCEILSLLNRHGFSISYFSDKIISFYDSRNYKAIDSSVPITSFFKMSKKEFIIFLDVVKRLDFLIKKEG